MGIQTRKGLRYNQRLDSSPPGFCPVRITPSLFTSGVKPLTQANGGIPTQDALTNARTPQTLGGMRGSTTCANGALEAVVHCMKVWRCYTEEQPYVHADHYPLQRYVLEASSNTYTTARWVKHINGVNTTIHTRPPKS